MDLCFEPIDEVASRIRKREVSPVELVDAYLAQIRQVDRVVHAYVTVAALRARTDARRAEREIARGVYRGPLHGIPLAFKDAIDTAGIRTTLGSRMFARRVPSRDAQVVRRLHMAGSVLLGKLAMHEFAIGAPNESGVGVVTRNPWRIGHDPGGSSSGGGAGVAMGLCAAAVGTDTAGSVRIPASYSGVVGLKPTSNLISLDGVAQLSWTLDTVGLLARRVADVGHLLSAVDGPAGAQAGPGVAPNDLHGIRIGIPRSLIASVASIDSEVLGAFEAALIALRRMGATLQPLQLANIGHAEVARTAILTTEAFAIHRSALARKGSLVQSTREHLLAGLFYSGLDYLSARRARKMIQTSLDASFRDVDVIATPTTTTTAPPFARYARKRSENFARKRATIQRSTHLRFTELFSLTGSPSLSIPCGFDRHGLPIGLMLSARAHNEAVLLRVGKAYELATPWHRRHPSLAPCRH